MAHHETGASNGPEEDTEGGFKLGGHAAEAEPETDAAGTTKLEPATTESSKPEGGTG